MTKPPNSIVLTCYALPVLAEWLRDEAHRQNVSKSEAIRRILEAARDKPRSKERGLTLSPTPD